MENSSVFARELIAKLDIGNLKSIYLNGRPGNYRTRFQLSELDSISPGLCEKLVADLLSNKDMDFQFEFPSGLNESLPDKDLQKLLKKLNNIIVDETDDFRETGVRSFGVGYPLIALKTKEQPDKIILAPLLIWHLNLSKINNKINSFSISRLNNEQDIKFNAELISFVSNNFKLELPGIKSPAVLDDGLIDLDEFNAIVRDNSKSLNGYINRESLEEICKIPDDNILNNWLVNGPVVFGSGVFGLYRNSRESIKNDLKLIEKNFKEFEQNTGTKKPEVFTYLPLNIDISQENIISNIDRHDKIIIQGPPGTGKSQSLTAILLWAIVHNKKCLVVCEKKTALDVLKANLKVLGIDNLSILIEDVVRDRRALVEFVRNNYLDSKPNETDPIPSGNKNFDKLKSDVENKISAYNYKLNKPGTESFGDHSFKSILGNFLTIGGKNSRIYGGRMNTQNFKFDYEEFLLLDNLVSESNELFKFVNGYATAYPILNNSIYKVQPSQKRLGELQDQLLKYKEKIDEIVKQVSVDINDIGEPSLREIAKTGMIPGLKMIFSKKAQLAKSKSELLQKSVSEINETLTEILNEPIQILFQAYNHRYVFEQGSSLVKQLSIILDDFSQFEAFYRWKHHYMAKSDQGTHHHIIELLSIENPADWQTEFRSWYLYNVLVNAEYKLGEMLTDDRFISELILQQPSYLKDLVKQVQSQHKINTTAIVENLDKAELKLIYNLNRNNKYSTRNSLRRIIEYNPDIFLSCFPIILTNPIACSSILPLTKGMFDLVMFDEASQLRIEDTYPALVRGKKWIISGDSQQLPPSDYFTTQPTFSKDDEEENTMDIAQAGSESLLNYAENLDSASFYLDFHYRSIHPWLIDFSNYAFYGTRLRPLPCLKEYHPIEFIQVNSTYNNRANEGESKVILDLLFSRIEKLNNGEWPSVGIVTFNQVQRDLIWEKILDQQEKEPAFCEKINNLILKGLFVKSLEHVQGDERDIIIFCTTFGPDEQGHFIQNFGPLNQEKGYKLLNVIITRSKYKMFVVTSIPEATFRNYSDLISAGDNRSRGLFYAFLSYAKACHERNMQERQLILDSVSTAGKISLLSGHMDLMALEKNICDELSHHFPANGIVSNYKLGGFVIDVMILDKDQNPVLALLTEGSGLKYKDVLYRNEIHINAIFNKLAIPYHIIRTINWWLKKEVELNHITNLVNEQL